MASEDVVAKTGETAVSTIVNLAEEAKIAREGVKAPSHAFCSIYKSLVAGGVAGGVSHTAVAPLERLKILLQDHISGMVYAFKKTVWHKGAGALYKDLVPNSVKVVPSIVIAFVTYEVVKVILGVEMRISD